MRINNWIFLLILVGGWLSGCQESEPSAEEQGHWVVYPPLSFDSLNVIMPNQHDSTGINR